MDAPDQSLRHRVADLLQKRPVAWRRATGGYTSAERWIVTFADDSSCFVKSGADLPGSMLADWLRREYHVYSRLDAPFLPQLLGWQDDGAQPLLLLEDLSHAHWPPPWTTQQVDAVLATLAQVREIDLPDAPGAEVLEPDLTSHWQEVRDRSEPSYRSASARGTGCNKPCRYLYPRRHAPT